MKLIEAKMLKTFDYEQIVFTFLCEDNRELLEYHGDLERLCLKGFNDTDYDWYYNLNTNELEVFVKRSKYLSTVLNLFLPYVRFKEPFDQ